MDSKLKDNETLYIVTWFCRDIQNILLNSSNKQHYNIIPQEIISIILQFTFNTHKWRIMDKSLINQILNATNKTSFVSNKFERCRQNLYWQLKIYPNGDSIKYIDSFDVFLKLITMPTEWKCVVIAFTIHSPQTCSKFSSIHQFDNTISKCYWPPYTLSLSELKQLHPSEIILTVDIEILRIIKHKQNEIIYQNPFKMNSAMQVNETWHIDETLTKKIKDIYKPNKGLCSHILKNMWAIYLWPKTDNQDGKIMCWVRAAMCYLPYDVSKISAKCTISFIEAHKTVHNERVLHLLQSKLSNTFINKQICSFNEFCNFSSHTISLNIIILKVWNNKNEIIYSFDPSQQIITKWNQLIKYKHVSDVTGSYQWVIENKSLIGNIFDCAPKEMFTSPKFIISALEFRLIIFPNGDNKQHSGSFQLYLELDTLPTKWKCIIAQITLYSPQTNSKITTIVSYEDSKSYWGWKDYSLLLQEIKQYNPIKLIFVANVEIIRIIENKSDIILYQNPIIIDPKMEINGKWLIDENIMKQLHNVKNSHFGKQLTSDIFGEIWIASVNLIKMKNISKCSLGLSLCCLPYGVSKILAKHTISFKEANKTEIGECEYTVENN
eukprot:536350_1